MRRITIGNLWVLAKRPSTPWPPNPWINSATLGPSPRLESSTQAAAYIADGEQANESTITAEHSRQDKKQQKVAISAWEDEGGSTAAPIRSIDLL